MKELIKEIQNLKYKIKSCQMQKREFEDPFKLPTTGLTERVSGGENNSPQERRIEKMDAIDDQINRLKKKLESLMNDLREFLVLNVEDFDCRLIVEQRLIYDKSWKEIETLRFMSTSAKQNVYYSQIKKLEMLKKERNSNDEIRKN